MKKKNSRPYQQSSKKNTTHASFRPRHRLNGRDLDLFLHRYVHNSVNIPRAGSIHRGANEVYSSGLYGEWVFLGFPMGF